MAAITQVSCGDGIFLGMDGTDAQTRLEVLESVRCLECGEVYSKPRQGGTVQKNPGCPACGYVGWLAVTLPHDPRAGRRRSAADRLQRLPVRSS